MFLSTSYNPSAAARAISIACSLLVTSVFASVAIAQDDNAFDRILDRDRLICGVSTGVPGFSEKDEKGRYSGFDVDFCRAVAAAMLGDDSKVDYEELDSSERFDALISRRVDVLFRNTTWTFTRDIEKLIDFAAINYYDGQGFLVKADSEIGSVADLNARSFCVQRNTTTDKNLTDYVQERDWDIERLYFDTLDEAIAAYLKGDCDSLTADGSALAGLRSTFEDRSAHRLLPNNVSKEPLALAVRQGDEQLRDVVAWTVYAMIAAEELGINQKNVDEIRNNSRKGAHRRLLGQPTDGTDSISLGYLLNLEDDWAYKVIRLVGNYGDVFENNLGPGTSVNLPRGRNALYTDGGLMYSPPFR